MTTAAHCPICLDYYPINADKPEFVIFPCGHGFCESCTNQLFSTLVREARCPSCRKFIHQREGHPIYLQLVDSEPCYALTTTAELIEGFGQKDHAPLLSLMKVSMLLGQLAKEITDGGVVSPLQKIIQDFNERIIPHFTTVEKEVEALREELHKSHRERDLLQTNFSRILFARNRLQEEKNRKLQKHLAKVREELVEAERATMSAVPTHEYGPGNLPSHEVSRTQSSSSFSDPSSSPVSSIGAPSSIPPPAPTFPMSSVLTRPSFRASSPSPASLIFHPTSSSRGTLLSRGLSFSRNLPPSRGLPLCRGSVPAGPRGKVHPRSQRFYNEGDLTGTDGRGCG